jgi:hypothetical protein
VGYSLTGGGRNAYRQGATTGQPPVAHEDQIVEPKRTRSAHLQGS